MSLQETHNECKTFLDQCDKELALLLAGRKASAPRLRKLYQDIKTRIPLMRKSITEHVKDLPTKTRTLKPDCKSSGDEEPAKSDCEEVKEEVKVELKVDFVETPEVIPPKSSIKDKTFQKPSKRLILKKKNLKPSV